MKTRRRIFRGWIDPRDETELPKRVRESTAIVFGNSAWHPNDKRCKITVEWNETKP